MLKTGRMITRTLTHVVAFGLVSAAQAGAVIHVDDDNCPGPGDGSELNPYCSIQDAIDAAVDTEVIVVAPGRYFETIDFLGKSITVRSSDGAMVTTIDAQLAGTVVTCDSGEGPGTALEGFTITGGLPFFFGGGMIIDASSPTVTSCTFSGNAFGGMVTVASSAIVTGCTFTDHTGVAAMANSGGNPTVTNCVFTRNTGGGMLNFDASPNVTGCIFVDNSTPFEGGGMLNQQGSSPLVSNCVFVRNTALEGGGMYNDDSSPRVTNCILWQNTPDQILDQGGAASRVSYSDVQGGWSGSGTRNIDADPAFVAPDTDFQLLPGSPCIDAGNNWGVARDAADLDADGDRNELTPRDFAGSPRFAVDGNELNPGCGTPVIVDMGAYEFSGSSFNVVFGDLDGNGTVGVNDLMILNGCLGSDDPECCVADLNVDGVVGLADRLLLGSSLVQFLSVTSVP